MVGKDTNAGAGLEGETGETIRVGVASGEFRGIIMFAGLDFVFVFGVVGVGGINVLVSSATRGATGTETAG
jgi:hypothetical protein